MCLACTTSRGGDRYHSTDTKHPTSQPDPPRPEHEQHQHELPSRSESKRHPFSARFSTFMDNLQTRLVEASQTISDLTGYSAIEQIKGQNAQLEAQLAAAQARLRAARAAYKQRTAERATTQREVTTLLARKDTWSPADLERFTALYRQDHELESRVQEAAAELTDAEADESRTSAALNAGILKRYHEEQIWSDRIRRQSTWGTWGLMGVNVLIFLGFQFVAEPWKRARLVEGVVEREKETLEEVRRELVEVKGALSKGGSVGGIGVGPAPFVSPEMATSDAVNPEAEASLAEALPEVPDMDATTPPTVSWGELLREPRKAKNALEDLYGERRINMRMRDVSWLVLESAMTGAAVAAGVAFLVLRRT